jgi:hypothetical protein
MSILVFATISVFWRIFFFFALDVQCSLWMKCDFLFLKFSSQTTDKKSGFLAGAICATHSSCTCCCPCPCPRCDRRPLCRRGRFHGRLPTASPARRKRRLCIGGRRGRSPGRTWPGPERGRGRGREVACCGTCSRGYPRACPHRYCSPCHPRCCTGRSRQRFKSFRIVFFFNRKKDRKDM